MKFTIFSTLATVLVAAVSASPIVNLEARDVFVPPITSPTAQSIWVSGTNQTVTWDTSNHPVNITNKVGQIFLRKSGLTLPVILAQGFDILLGTIQVPVPDVVEASDYQIVLFGDSGNFSPNFTIKGSGISW